MRSVGVTPLGAIAGNPNALLLVAVATAEGEQRYFLPVSVAWGEENLAFGAHEGELGPITR